MRRHDAKYMREPTPNYLSFICTKLFDSFVVTFKFDLKFIGPLCPLAYVPMYIDNGLKLWLAKLVYESQSLP